MTSDLFPSPRHFASLAFSQGRCTGLSALALTELWTLTNENALCCMTTYMPRDAQPQPMAAPEPLCWGSLKYAGLLGGAACDRTDTFERDCTIVSKIRVPPRQPMLALNTGHSGRPDRIAVPGPVHRSAPPRVELQLHW